MQAKSGKKPGIFRAFCTISLKILFGMKPGEKKEIEKSVLRLMDFFNNELVVLQCLTFYLVVYLFLIRHLNFGYAGEVWIVMLILTPIAIIYLTREVWKSTLGLIKIIFYSGNLVLTFYYLYILMFLLFWDGLM